MKQLFTTLLIALAAVTLSAQELSVQIDSITPNLCGGGNNACIHATVSGGTAPYSYTWTRGTEDPIIVGHEEDVCGLVEGFYFLTAVDANSDEVKADAIVVDPAQTTVSVNASQLSAIGANDGSLTVTYVEGGSGNWQDFTYEWTNEQGWIKQGMSIELLPAGIYYLTIHDEVGCKNAFPDPFVLTQPDPEPVLVYDTIAVFDTTFVTETVTVFDTTFVTEIFTVYDTIDVIKFTEVAEIASLTDPVSGASFWVKNFGDHLEASEPFVECKVYSITGSLVKQVNSSTEVPVGDLSGIYLFYFKFTTAEIMQRFYIE
jgi:hypothetical protein